MRPAWSIASACRTVERVTPSSSASRRSVGSRAPARAARRAPTPPAPAPPVFPGPARSAQRRQPPRCAWRRAVPGCARLTPRPRGQSGHVATNSTNCCRALPSLDLTRSVTAIDPICPLDLCSTNQPIPTNRRIGWSVADAGTWLRAAEWLARRGLVEQEALLVRLATMMTPRADRACTSAGGPAMSTSPTPPATRGWHRSTSCSRRGRRRWMQSGRCAAARARTSSPLTGTAVPDPWRILCLGVNYRDHAIEGGREVPTWPEAFVRGRGSVLGPYADLVKRGPDGAV